MTMNTPATALLITFSIGAFVREWHRANGQRISSRTTWGLAVLGLVAIACMIIAG
jgi:hypothetical protein